MKTLIADSGGTNTDWCLIDEEGVKNFFVTESYHPNNWSNNFFNNIKRFWSDFDCNSINLYFFGAGCLSSSHSEKLVYHFELLEFNSVKVNSDLHAAAYCTLGAKNGTVAILGTGSVLFSWENSEVENIIGGKGHLEEDEGSGYYFGKIILSAYLQNKLSEEQLTTLKSQCLDVASIEITNKYDVARIASQLSSNKLLFKKYHLQNFQLFARKHIFKNKRFNLQIVGSYGTNHIDYLKQELSKVNVVIEQVVDKPISLLVEQRHLFID